jgi:hypothetical protein
MKGNEMKGKEMNMDEHLYIHIKPPPTPRNKLQSNMPYDTFQGNIEMQSHKTGGHHIQVYSRSWPGVHDTTLCDKVCQ